MTGRRSAAILGMALSAAVAWFAFAPGPAAAAPTTQVIRGEFLRIESVADWDAAASLMPGDAVQWDLAVSAVPPEPSTVHVGIHASGDAPLHLTIRSCATVWDGDACPGGARELRTEWAIPLDASSSPLLSVASDHTVHLRLDVRMPEPSVHATRVTVSASVSQETVSVSPHAGGIAGGLASTGPSMGMQAALAGGAAVILAAGAVLLLRSRRRDEEETS